jgi:DNA-binding NarL/FixJ family response regulator
MIRVVIADDHSLVREGLRRILDEQFDIEVVGEAKDGKEAVELAGRLRPDVILLDISMPGKDGLDATKEIRALDTRTKILILTIHNEEHYALRTLRAGAHGFIFKGAKSEDLVRAIHDLDRGLRYLPPELERIFAELYVCPRAPGTLTEALTDREFQVLRLIALGHTNREVAEKLRISVKTVDTHRRNILKKLQLRNNADLTRFAIQHGIIE